MFLLKIKLLSYIILIQLILSLQVYGTNIDSLIKNVVLEKNDTSKIRKLAIIVNELRNKGEYDYALKYCDEIYTISKTTNYNIGEAISYRLKSTIYLKKNDFEKAIYNSNKSIDICRAINNPIELCRNYSNLGNVYLEQGHNQKALEFQLKALSIAEKLKDTLGIGKLYNSIGNINDNFKNYEKAIVYYNNAYTIFEKSNNQELLAGALSNIGNCYNHQNNNDSALTYYFKSSEIYLKTNNKLGLAYVNNNIGVIYSKINDPKNALFYYEKALKLTIALKQRKAEATLYKNIGDIYIYIYDLEKAELNLNKALAINKELDYTYGLMSTFKSLSELQSNKKKPELALEYYKKYIAIKDSFYSIESAKDINQKIIKYESALKDKEIALLNAEKTKKEFEDTKNRAIRNSIIILGFSIALISIFLIAFLSSKKQRMLQKQFLRQLIHSQEDERKRISKELHDGIGQSLVVIKNNMNEDKSLIENTIDELRAISRNLHPIQLERLGFKGAIESIVNDASKVNVIYFSHEIEDVSEFLNPEHQINIYRIIQECISNIIKHSNATDGRVIIMKDKNHIKLSVFDNGKGFDLTEAKKKKTLGLKSIEERVKLINGQLIIYSTNEGTKLEILLKYV